MGWVTPSQVTSMPFGLLDVERTNINKEIFMLQTSFTLTDSEMVITFSAVRNEVSKVAREKISFDLKGYPVVTTDISDLGIYPLYKNIVTSNSIINALKCFIKVVPKEIKEDHKFTVSWARILRRLKSKTNAEEKAAMISQYQKGLLFKYEQHPNIKVQTRKVTVTLYDEYVTGNRFVLVFSQKYNRETFTHCSIMVKSDLDKYRTVSYSNDIGKITQMSVLHKQIEEWLNLFQVRYKPYPFIIENMRKEIYQNFSLLKEEIEELLNRIDNNADI